jgi:hypothetical protein
MSKTQADIKDKIGAQCDGWIFCADGFWHTKASKRNEVATGNKESSKKRTNHQGRYFVIECQWRKIKKQLVLLFFSEL